MQVQVLNIAYAAAGLPFAPQADPGDDLLDVVVVEERHRAEMVGWLEEPEPRGAPPVTARCGRRVRVTSYGAPLHLVDQFLEPGDRPRPIELAMTGTSVKLLLSETGDAA